MRIRHWKRWLIGGAILVVLAVVGGPFVYIHFVEGSAPAPLSLSNSPGVAASPGATAAAIASVDGSWKVASGSQVGYRVSEILFGQSHVAVGRTSSIQGSFVLNGTTVESGSFTADMRMVTSDQSRRDEQFNGRIMETSTYPTGTFVLDGPVELGSLPADGVTRTVRVSGTLTLHGTKRRVTFELSGRRTGSKLQVSGSIPITFADWDIPDPSFGPISTQDHGTLEFLLTFTHA